MTDHAVLVPTSVGPVGAIVSEPDRPPRGVLILLQGDGRPGRSGINAVWTRLARELADAGVRVLRFDYPGEGDGAMIRKNAVPDADRGRGTYVVVLREVVSWLRRRTGVDRLMLFGDCLGGRLAVELARGDPDVVGTFLSVPYVREGFVELERRRRPAGRVRRATGRIDRYDFDRDLLDALPGMLARGPVWMLRGERDGDEAHQVKRLLGSSGRRLEIEVVPDIAVHPVSSDRVQAEVTRRLARRVLRAVDELQPAAGRVPAR